MQPETTAQSAAFGLVLLFFIVVIYMLPWLIAFNRAHRNTVPIFIVNFFLGWTLVGWVASLAWAFTSDKPTK